MYWTLDNHKMHQLLFAVLCSIAVVTGQLLDPNCTVESSRMTTIRRVGATLLGRLGMQEAPPNPPGPVVVPEKMITDFMVVNELDIRQSEVDQICMIQPPRAKDVLVFFPKIETFPFIYYPEYYYHYGYYNLKVNIPPLRYKLEIPLNLTNINIVSSAELVVLSHVASYRKVLQEIETIQISLVYTKQNHYYSDTVKEIILTQVLNVDDGFVHFNVTNGLKRWLEINQHLSGVGTMELEVAILPPQSLHHHFYFPPVLEFDISSQNNTQFVVMTVPSEQLGGRKKRQTLDGAFCFGSPNEPNCCIRELTIDFHADLDWLWVLSPIQYQLNYCVGLCPIPWPTASLATEFFQLFVKNNPGSTAKPCCTRDETGPLSLLVLLDDGSQIVKFEDLITYSCICR